jgi:hypothetical protein
VTACVTCGHPKAKHEVNASGGPFGACLHNMANWHYAACGCKAYRAEGAPVPTPAPTPDADILGVLACAHPEVEALLEQRDALLAACADIEREGTTDVDGLDADALSSVVSSMVDIARSALAQAREGGARA